MATEIEIINSAIAKIRGKFITSLADNTTEARLAKVLYPVIRDRLLRECAPNFARKLITLGQLDETPAWGFDYIYQVPSNVMKILEVEAYTPEQWRYLDNRVYANSTTFKCEVIIKVTDAEKYDAVFAETIAYSLAAEMALPLTNGAAMAKGFKEEAELLARRCRSYSSQERGSVQQPDAREWLNSRYSG